MTFTLQHRLTSLLGYTLARDVRSYFQHPKTVDMFLHVFAMFDPGLCISILQGRHAQSEKCQKMEKNSAPSTAACKAVTPEAVDVSKEALASSSAASVSASPAKAAAMRAVALAATNMTRSNKNHARILKDP